MKKLLFRSLLLALSIVHCQLSISFAQGEANNWYFGRYAGLTFNTNPPTPLTDGRLNTNEGCVAMSDKNGNLLFYTNGVTVWNKNHGVMQNGLMGDGSSTNSGIVIPKPGTTDRYYIVTVPEAGRRADRGLRYSEVDMAAGNGMGLVVSANTVLHAPLHSYSEKVAATAHANGIDYWVISYDWETGEYFSYLVTCNGFDGIKHSSGNIGLVRGWGGYLVVSPDGKKVAAGYQGANSSGLEIFDFDNSTGLLSNKQTLLANVASYGVAFSPDGKKLYSNSGYGNLYQWDLTSPVLADIIASRYKLNDAQGGWTNRGALQLGPDGKIYGTQINQPLSVINSPNEAGAACGYAHYSIPIPTTPPPANRRAEDGLPPFVSSFFAPPVQISGGDDAQPATVPFDFGVTGSGCGTFSGYTVKVEWDFGDGEASADCEPNHKYDSEGVYTVTAYVTTTPTGCAPTIDTLTKQVVVGHGLHLLPTGDQTICLGDEITLQAENPDGYLLTWSNDRDANWPATNGAGTYTVSPTETTMYTVKTKVRDGNTSLIANGDFEAGNTGFDSQYQYMPEAFNGQHGVYGVGSDPKPRDPTAYATFADHTPGAGKDKMLIVEGVNTPSPGMYFWRQTVQNTVPGGEYVFSAWFTHLRTGGNRSATVRVFINGQPVGDITVTTQNTGLWQRLRFNWTADGTTADIRMEEISGVQHNDFAVDDISLYPLKDEDKNITVKVNKVEKPTANADQAFCPKNGAYVLSDLAIDSNITITGQQWQSFHWYAAATGGARLADNLQMADGTTYYASQILKLDNSLCESTDRQAVTFHLNKVGAGEIHIDNQDHQIICEVGGTPSLIESQTDMTAPSGAITSYRWYKRDEGGAWDSNPISGATDADYQPVGPFTKTTDYKRVAVSVLHGVECTAESNIIRVEVVSVPAPVPAETVLHACEPGATDFTYTVAWLRPAPGDEIKWYDADTGGNLLSPTDLLTVGSYWTSQLAKVNGMECWSKDRTEVKFRRDITVDAGAITILDDNNNQRLTQTICWPNPGIDNNGPILGLLKSTGGGTSGGIYTWKIIKGDGTPETFGGAGQDENPWINVDADYLHGDSNFPGLLPHVNKFAREMRVDAHGETCRKLSNVVAVRVRTVDGGVISGAQAVCVNSPLVPLDSEQGSLPKSNTGNYASSDFSYEWEVSTDGNAPWNSTGHYGADYPLGAHTATKVYRRKASKGGDGFPNCFAHSNNTVTVRVRQGGSDGCKIILDKRVAEKTGDSNGDGKAQVGEVLTYTIEILGQYDRDEMLTVLDDLPAHTVFQTGSLKLFRDGTEITPLPVPETALYDDNARQIRWNNYEVPKEKNSTVPYVTKITFDVKVDDTDLTGVDKLVNHVKLEDLSGNLDPHVPSDDRKADVPITLDPKKDFSITKELTAESKDANSEAQANEELTYTITVENKGNIDLNGLKVTDIVPAGTTIVAGDGGNNFDTPSGLPTWTVDVPYRGGSGPLTLKVKVTDNLTGIDWIKNTADATYESVHRQAKRDIPTLPEPKLELEKKADRRHTYQLHDKIEYEIVVKNTGSVDVSGIEVEDGNADMQWVGAVAHLAARTDISTFKAYHTVTQVDVDSGYVANRARVTKGTPSSGTLVTDDSTDPSPCGDCPARPNVQSLIANGWTVVPVKSDPGKLDLTKKVRGFLKLDGTPTDAIRNEGEKIIYEITVTNTGGRTLHDVVVTDINADDPNKTWAVGDLAPNQPATKTVLHTVTQAEVDAGKVDNLAHATGKNPQNEPAGPTPSVDPDNPSAPATTVEIERKPGMEIQKKALDKTTDYKRGDEIHYEITVRNSGNTTLTDIEITDAYADATPPGSWKHSIPTLLPEQTETITGIVHTVTQADVDAGKAQNVAFASAQTPIGDGSTTETIYDSSKDPDNGDQITEVEVDKNAKGEVELTKQVSNPGTAWKEGDKIKYDIIVRNTGDLTLTNIQVTDPKADEKSFVIVRLAPQDAPHVITAHHTVTQADIDAGEVLNLATVTAEAPRNGLVQSVQSRDPSVPGSLPGDPTEVKIDRSYGMTVEKKVVSSGPYADGDVIDYEITVKNTGNTTLTNITLTDDNADAPNNAWGPFDLTPQQKDTVFKAVHKVTQDDVDAGEVLNLASAKGEDPNGDPVTADSSDPDDPNGRPGDPTDIEIERFMEMQTEKTIVDRDRVYLEGDVIAYKITVRNTGNVRMFNVEVKDDNAVLSTVGTDDLGNSVANPVTVLAPGGSVTFTAERKVTDADIDAGYVYNQAKVRGTDPDGNDVTADSADPDADDEGPNGYVAPKDPDEPGSTVIRVGVPPIVAEDDAFHVWTGWTGVVGSVLANDTFDGLPAGESSRIKLEPGTPENPALMEMDPTDGTIRLRQVLRPGRYIYPYLIRQENYPSNYAEAEAHIDVVDPKSGLHIPNVFSPNGDGVNDTFEILGRSHLGVSRIRLLIVDRWGVKVYESEDYRNDWDAEGIPAGTYYYHIDAHRDSGEVTVVKGWVTVMRRRTWE